MVGVGDAGEVFVGQLAVGAVDHAAQFAGVDEQDFAAPVSELTSFTITGEKPQTGGDLGRIEELAGQRDHAVHEVGFDQVFPDFALAGLARRHGTVGEHEAGDAPGRQVMAHVLHPAEVGVALGRGAVLPALVLNEPLAAPV